jgi:hypothetical protein
MTPATRIPRATKWFRPAPAILLLAPFLLLVPLLDGGPGQSAGQRTSKDAAPDAMPPVEAEVRFTDDSVLKLTLRDKGIGMATRYGKLRVPLTTVRYIDFATRIPPTITQRAEAAVAKLGDLQYAVRQAAGAELLELREKAYPALLQALKHKDPEIVRRAETLLKQLHELVPQDQLAFRKDDVVRTVDSRITGRIEGESLKALTFQFGEVQLKLAHMRSLQYTSVDPDPGNVDELRGLIGKTFRFNVTGTLDGRVFGSGVYTSDSPLATAAVHAGVLKAGQTGVVRVTFVVSPPGFGASAVNGVTSAPYGGSFRGAYVVSR